MAVNDDDRFLALVAARAIYEHHMRVDPAGCNANHISTDIDYEETLRRGLLAECAFANEFNLKVNAELLAKGDGGRDFSLRLYANALVRSYPVDIKAKSVRSNFEGMVRVGTHLRVPVSEIHPMTIYVFAVYHELTDDADVLKWEWGRTLIHRDEKMAFERGNGSQCYVMRYEYLRDLQELKDRMRPHGFAGYDQDGNFLHYCHCGQWGAFGSGVSLRAGRLGTWHCAEHGATG
jgi:hypothetical protein